MSFPGGSVVKTIHLPMHEEEMATHSNVLAGIIPWAEEPCGIAIVHEVAESDTTEATEHAHRELQCPLSWGALKQS